MLKDLVIPMANRAPRCNLCGAPMKRSKYSTGNAAGIAGAIIVLLIGIALTMTIIGAIAGIPLIICALFMGGKTQKVWKCKSCKHIEKRR